MHQQVPRLIAVQLRFCVLGWEQRVDEAAQLCLAPRAAGHALLGLGGQDCLQGTGRGKCVFWRQKQADVEQASRSWLKAAGMMALLAQPPPSNPPPNHTHTHTHTHKHPALGRV